MDVTKKFTETLTFTTFNKIGQRGLTLLGQLGPKTVATYFLGLCVVPLRNASAFKTKTRM